MPSPEFQSISLSRLSCALWKFYVADAMCRYLNAIYSTSSSSFQQHWSSWCSAVNQITSVWSRAFALFKNAILDIIWGRRFFFSQFCAPFCCYIKWVWFEVIRLFIKCKAERIYFWSYRKKGFCVMFTMNCANIQYPVNRQIFNSNLWIGNILRILSFLEYSVNFEIKKSKINFAYLFLYIQFPREFVIWL